MTRRAVCAPRKNRPGEQYARREKIDQASSMRAERIKMLSKVIRVHRKDSAFVYAILESLEGMASYSTLDSAEGGQSYRDLRLVIADGFVNEVEEVLNGLRKKFPVLELPSDQDNKGNT